MRDSHVYAVAGALTALSFVFNWLPFFKTPWGMQLDLVGVFWFAAFMLFGLRVSFLVSAATAILFAFLTPGGWIGAVLKFAATFSMILAAYALTRISKTQLKSVSFAAIVLVFAVSFRSIVTSLLNIFAIPLFAGWPLDAVLKLMPEIITLNIILGAIDFGLAWLIVYKSGLYERFAQKA